MRQSSHRCSSVAALAAGDPRPNQAQTPKAHPATTQQLIWEVGFGDPMGHAAVGHVSEWSSDKTIVYRTAAVDPWVWRYKSKFDGRAGGAIRRD